ncbi:MAG: xanthine dehydrogenase accessory protein XdhC [Burkholderiaceae bacterium]|nr:xanthine dehydrogenase accessory protein XdhC [Burkholderiaceae bacterium]
MNRLRETAADWIAIGEPTVLVEVLHTQGSVPRDVGARMLVSTTAAAGTVGGGHLELKAIEQARQLLNDASAPLQVRYPLGPALGQCCGGVVTLGFSVLTPATLAAWPIEPARFHLQLYGAGHVGRAVARLLADLPVAVDWIDEREYEFPDALGTACWPAHIRKRSVDVAEGEVDSAAPGDSYLVLTHRHDLDLRITEAILKRGDFGFLGLIGSHTKKQRFLHHFESRGIPPEVLARLTCPIGLPGISGKEPELVALAVVAQLMTDRP